MSGAGRRHLAIDVRALSPQRDGLSSYILGIVPRLIKLAPEWDVSLIANSKMVGVVRSWGGDVIVNNSRPMWTGQNLTIPRVVRRLSADVFFYPAHDPPLGRIPCPFVIVVHDLTPLRVRPYFERFDRVKRIYLRIATARGIARAARIIAVSGATRDSIADMFGGTAARKTHVVHNGCEPPRTESTGANEHFLYLGTDRPHKNVLGLIDGYAIAVRDRPDLPNLVLVGGFRSPRRVAESISNNGIDGHVRIMGHVSDSVAEDLLGRAMALAMPSFVEGFGMPIVEAMARGVPVITSDRSACKEVAHDAALFVDPTDPHSIAEALVEVAANPQLRSRLADEGRRRATVFDWDDAARLTFEEIVGSADAVA